MEEKTLSSVTINVPYLLYRQTNKIYTTSANGELLTDEFGNPLITEVDTFYLPDATAKRSTSVVVPTKESAFSRPIYVSRGSATVQYADLDVHVLANCIKTFWISKSSYYWIDCIRTRWWYS